MNSGLPSARWKMESASARSGEVPSIAVGQFLGLAAGEPRQLVPLHPLDPGQLGEQRPKRMGAVQLVGAEGHHDQHVAQRALVADEECEQVAA